VGHVRPLRYLALLLLIGCDNEPQGVDDPCGVATSMNEAALTSAKSSAPACESDQDCVVVHASVLCPTVEIGDCGRTVHRVAAEQYLKSGVNEDICDAVEGSELGCGFYVLCAAQKKAPRCQSGQCVSENL
jgi:hypothetical protein